MTDKLFFYSKSADKYPGKGMNEIVHDSKNYVGLSKIKNWRHMLSNFYISPFVCEGKRWSSVEHYYHSKKFVGNFSNQFSMDSKSSFCIQPDMAKGAGGKSGKYKGQQLRPKNIVADMKRFNPTRAFTISMFCKFTQNEMLKNTLLQTGHAELWHVVSRSPHPVRFVFLEKVRRCIRRYQQYDLEEIGKRIKY